MSPLNDAPPSSPNGSEGTAKQRGRSVRRLPRYAPPVLGPEIHKASCVRALSGPVFGEDSNIWVVLSICGCVLAPSLLAREDVENSVQYRSRMLLAWLQLAKSPKMQPGHHLNSPCPVERQSGVTRCNRTGLRLTRLCLGCLLSAVPCRYLQN